LQNLITFVFFKTAKIHMLDPDPNSESGSGSRRRFEFGSNPDPQTGGHTNDSNDAYEIVRISLEEGV